MGICASKPPAVKQDVPAAPAQNGSLHSAKPPAEPLPSEAPLSNANVAPEALQLAAVPTSVRQLPAATHTRLRAHEIATSELL